MKKYLLLIVFLFVVGIYSVEALEIPVNSYVIGEYLFTRDGSDLYNGQLSTDYIMLASKSIDSKDLRDMTIYFKIAEGQYINGATGEEIDDSFLDHDLAKKIKYYDMKKIPTVTLSMSADIKLPGATDKKKYFFGYETFDKEEESNKNLYLNVDYYGVNGTIGAGNELFVVHYPDEEDFDELGLTYLDDETISLEYNASADVTYTVVGYPYIVVRTRAGAQKKIYLEFDSSYIQTIKNDLNANGTVENGKLKVNVTDSTNKKYKIAAAYLYFYSNSQVDSNARDYLTIYDLVGLYQQIETQVPDLKGIFNNNTAKALDYVKKAYSNGAAGQIVDIYSAMTNIPENMSTDIELHDLGNSENRDRSQYHFIVTVYDDNGNVYYVPSERFNINAQSGYTINQPTIDNNYISGGNSTDLLQIILLFNSLLSMSE